MGVIEGRPGLTRSIGGGVLLAEGELAIAFPPPTRELLHSFLGIARASSIFLRASL